MGELKDAKKVIEQRGIDVAKVSDLRETLLSNSKKAYWIIDGETFTYSIGEDHLKSRTGLNSPWEIWPLAKSNKTAAKAKVFALIK